MGKIKLICRRPGFRRCGVAHPSEKIYDEDYWTEDQLKTFDEDPQFEVLTSKASEGGGSKDPGKPEGDELQAAIIAEIKKLEPGEKPKVKPISDALGYTVTGKELGAVIEAMKAPSGT